MDKKVKIWEFIIDWREHSLLRKSVPSPTIAAARKYCPFYGRKTIVCIIGDIQNAFSYLEFIVNSNIVVTFHHKMAMRFLLEYDEIERQLKCKIRDVGMCIIRCFEEDHTMA
jgi:hypothetical protein